MAQQRDFLFVQSTTEVGGAETVLLNSFAANAELRARSVVATLGHGRGDLPERLRALGVEVVELPSSRLREPAALARNLWRLRTLARERGSRVIVGNGAHPQVFAGVAARMAGAKSLFLVHMIHRAPLWKNHPIDALALGGPCDLMLAVSEAARRVLDELRPGVPREVLHNGTPLVRVPDDEARRARAELGFAPEHVVFGVFGRLQRWKGQDVFIEAAGRLAQERPNFRFVVVGGSVFGLEPEFLEGLRRRAQELGLADRVVFTGFRRDVPRLMAACDVGVHTSREPEAFGMVVVEAMAQARPVIATRPGGPVEIIGDSGAGLLVEPDDPAALARAMRELGDDPAHRSAMGELALERVRTAFSSEAMARGLLGHLERLLAR